MKLLLVAEVQILLLVAEVQMFLLAWQMSKSFFLLIERGKRFFCLTERLILEGRAIDDTAPEGHFIGVL